MLFAVFHIFFFVFFSCFFSDVSPPFRNYIQTQQCPMSILNTASLHKVDLLFRSLRLTTLYLHDERNRFVGKVERDDLIFLGKNHMFDRR